MSESESEEAWAVEPDDLWTADDAGDGEELVAHGPAATPGERGSVVLALAASVVALLMSGMALFQTQGGSTQFDVTRSAVLESANRMESVAGDLDALQSTLDRLEAELRRLAQAQTADRERVGVVVQDTQAAFDQIERVILANQRAIETLRAGLGTETRTAARPPAEPVETRSTVTARTTPLEATPPGSPPVAQGTGSAAQSRPATTGNTPSTSLAEATTAADRPASRRTHVVVQGDILWNLARRYETSVDALILANPTIDPNRLRVGTELVIP